MLAAEVTYAEPWAWPAYVGRAWVIGLLLGGIAIALIVQSRRPGGLTRRRAVATIAAVGYVALSVAYTMLPAPPRSPGVCLPVRGSTWNLVPLSTVVDAWETLRPLGWRARIVNRVTMQLVFNVALFVPLGIGLRRFLGLGVARAVVCGFAASLLLEVTQGTGNWGLWPCPYRYFQVDDLLTNTLGVAVGASGAWSLSWWTAPGGPIRRALPPTTTISVARRRLGMVLDLAAGALVWVGASMAVRVALLSTNQKPPPVPLHGERVATFAIVLAVAVAFPALTGSGASIGQRLAAVEPRWPARPRVTRRAVRAFATSGASVVLIAVADAGPQPWQRPAFVGAITLVATSMVAVGIGNDRRGISGRCAGATYAPDVRPSP